MAIRIKALGWLSTKYNVIDKTRILTSKYYPPHQLKGKKTILPSNAWWIEIPLIKINALSGCFYLICQKPDIQDDFYCLKVDVDYIRENMDLLFFKTHNDKVCLWLSADKDNRFVDLKGSKLVDFSRFCVDVI